METVSSLSTVPPVLVQVYAESLCIDCKNFFTDHLLPTYRLVGPTVIDLQVVPFGNAELLMDTKDVQCQHGVAECDANSWEQCAATDNSLSTFLGFMECLELSLPMGRHDSVYHESIFQNCAEWAILDFADLKECHDDPERQWELQQQASLKTPAHDHVPWVLIDGQYMDEEQYDFLDEVCKAYSAHGGSSTHCEGSYAQDDHRDNLSKIVEKQMYN